MTGYRPWCSFVLLLVVTLPGCKSKGAESSRRAKASASASAAEAMPASLPGKEPEPARPAAAPDAAAPPRVAPASDAAVAKRPSGPLRKGSKEYKSILKELVGISLSRDDKPNPKHYAYRCKGKECDRVGARDNLTVGTSRVGLDDRASSVSTTMGAKSRISSNVPPAALGPRDGSRVRAKVRARIYALRSCHRRVLKKTPKAEGTVKIRFTIAANGRVNNVSVTGTPASVLACVKGKVARWSLGKIPRSISYGPLTVRFTISK